MFFARTPPPQFNLSELHNCELLYPVLLPSVVDLLALRSATSGSSSSSVSTQAHTLDETPASMSAPLLSTLQKAAACVVRHSLLKSIQRIRHEELACALDPLLPLALAEMIQSYADEVALLPLQLDDYGCAINTSVNEPIIGSIREIILSGEPDWKLFKWEVLKNHVGQLDTLFAPRVHSPERIELYKAVAHNKPQALQQLRSEFEVAVNYLPYSSCQTLLDRLRQRFKALSPTNVDATESCALDIRLLIDAMQKKVDPVSDKYQRSESLQYAWADTLVIRATLELKDTNQHTNATRAYGLFLDALKIFCRLGNKHRVVKVVVELIRLGATEQTGNYRDLLKFYTLAKKLCLAYPANFRLYADLLFAMDAVCRKHADFSMARDLYRQAVDDGMRLPFSYHAKMLYLHIQADYLAGESTAVVVERIKSAMASMGKGFRTLSDRIHSGRSLDTDLSMTNFFICFAYQYQLLAAIGLDQLSHFKELNFQQQDECAAMFELNLSVEGLMGWQVHRIPSLQHGHTTLNTPTERMVYAIAGYCKNALTLLIGPTNGYEASETAEKAFVSVFDMLVKVYLDARQVESLATLLAEENVTRLVQYPSFKSALPAWRESLVMMKEAQEKTKESEAPQ